MLIKSYSMKKSMSMSQSRPGQACTNQRGQVKMWGQVLNNIFACQAGLALVLSSLVYGLRIG